MNQPVRDKLGVQNAVLEVNQYQQKWLRRLQRMDTNRLPKVAVRFETERRTNIGRLRESWKDQLHLQG
jgi:predicted nucleic acid-binding Zn ribbon protein